MKGRILKNLFEGGNFGLENPKDKIIELDYLEIRFLKINLQSMWALGMGQERRPREIESCQWAWVQLVPHLEAQHGPC